jgi:hypothetical protein
MRLRKGFASLALVSVLLLAMLGIGAPTAGAVSVDKVTGGQFALFVPLQTVGDMSRAGLFTTPIAPAYLTFTLEEGPAVRFPISGGTVESSTMLGTVDSEGGLKMEKWSPSGVKEKELQVTQVKIVNGNMLVGNALGLVPAPTADLVNATHSKDPATGVIHYEADARVNLVTATVLNTYFGTDFFTDGFILGRVKADIQTGPLL